MHTPGPWEAEPIGCGEFAIRAYFNGRRNAYRIANVKISNDVEANAALIAAAPELLEAAIKTVQENLNLADGDNCTLRHLKAAIAKACPALVESLCHEGYDESQSRRRQPRG